MSTAAGRIEAFVSASLEEKSWSFAKATLEA
jgi:hypothetical protein